MIVTTTSGQVTVLTLSQPPVNAISEEWVRAFDAKLDELAGGSPCTVLHIRSDQKVFCAGADLREVRTHMEAPDGAERMYAYVAGIQRLYARIEQLPQVVLAEIGGAAMGGGLELALACDLRIAATEARLGLPEVRLGLLPGAGGTQRLTRLCGAATRRAADSGRRNPRWCGGKHTWRGELGGAARRTGAARRGDRGRHREPSRRRPCRQQGMHCGGRSSRPRRIHRRTGIHPAASW